MSIMLEEILLAPEAIRRAIEANKKTIKEIGKEFKSRKIENITTVARGSSNNAATMFKYLAEIIGNKIVSKFSPSITTVYDCQLNLGSNMLLAVSQSGMSTDTFMVAENAKKSGSLVVAVTNNPNSPLAKIAHYHIDLSAGEEVSITATKTYFCHLAVLFMLANEISEKPAKMNINEIPAILESFIAENLENIKELAVKTRGIKNVVILTRGLMQSIADEMSLKMMELTYTLTRSFSTTDFMHGALAIIEEGTNVILLAESSKFTSEYIDMAMRLNLLGANLIAFTNISEVKDIAINSMVMPYYAPLVAPYVYGIAVSLYTNFLAEAENKDTNLPRNLKKVIITK